MYGVVSLAELDVRLKKKARAAGHELMSYQSNAEAELIDRVQQARNDGTELILINPGAYTHTSVALRDAFLGVSVPFIEVHISNVHARETFRKQSYLSDIAKGVITGLGVKGYELALDAAIEQLK